ncbi:MAG: hypothetical protein E7365_04130 [Clostridiales bacterium]|nr:hypothetical protein [Clostridiales bacterium]
MRLYDIHTHIIPGIDDGAINREQSIEMLKMLKEAGITDVVLTPHYYPFEMPLKSFLKKRQMCFDEIKDVFDELGLKAHLGAEVYLSDVLFALENINELCIDGKNYLLLELPYGEKNKQKIINALHQINANYSAKIILAHLNRYPRFFKKDSLYELNMMGCYIQVDSYLFNCSFKRKKILKLIDMGLVHFVGSDCHNSTTRKPAFDLLKNNIDEKTYYDLLGNFENI